MVIDSTATTLNITNLTNVIQQQKIKNKIQTIRPERKIIPFPNKQILEQEVRKTNLESMMNDRVSADYTSRRYLHLLLVAGSYALARSRKIAVNS